MLNQNLVSPSLSLKFHVTHLVEQFIRFITVDLLITFSNTLNAARITNDTMIL